MAVSLPIVESPAPGILVARYEWPHLLQPEMQGELVTAALAASAHGPVGVVFVLADRICAISPTVRVFWRKVVGQTDSRIAVMAIVTRSWAIEVETMGFAVTIERLGAPVRIAPFAEEAAATAWVAGTLRALQPARGEAR
jgi:hypothetical protein